MPRNELIILDVSPLGQCVLDEAFCVCFWNRSLELWTGISRRDILGTDLRTRFPHLAAPKYQSRIASVLAGGPPVLFSSQLHKYLIPAPLPGERFRFQESTISALKPVDGVAMALISVQDVTSLREAIEGQERALRQLMFEVDERKKTEAELTRLNQVLQELSIRDGLTGLYNHRHFYQSLNQDFLLANRAGSDLSCIIFDLDHFKLINDTYGHPSGDEILKKTAGLVESKLRRTDIIARYGGEEFAILLHNTPPHAALQLAESLRLAIADTEYQIEGGVIRVTASFGIASSRLHKPKAPSDLLALADRALYRAKNGGRNRTELF